jgi:tRNA-splicing ligase RtcB (3'-phosphate/5'-hydroxy nucleic acid ligase)
MELKKIGEYEFEIPKENGMNVPGLIFASEKLINQIKGDKSLEQVKNVAKLPGILKASFAMPDMHQGYGFPIGGVAAFDLDKGVISPGGVGYDINCGVRLLATNIKIEDFMNKRTEVLHDFKRTIPSGVGRGHNEKLSIDELNEILEKGAEYAVERGMGTKEDLKRCEEGGRIKDVNVKDVSSRAKSRGLAQAGTLGAGNHFLEVQRVEEIYDEDVAAVFGVKRGDIVIMIHCGSRGLGHQVASDYIKMMDNSSLVDRELVNAPIKSELGQKYLSAMGCATNFAFCNRQMIMSYVRDVLNRHFSDVKSQLVYDVCHNVAKIEEHEGCRVCVHRKGATRSFGPERKELPEVYRRVGQPVIIPGSMGTASYLMVGTKKSEELAWGSTSHGAGRVMSRSQAINTISSDEVVDELHRNDIEIEAGSKKGISEEAPQAYKNIDEVVEICDKLGLAKKVARLKPLAVIKG